MKIFIKTLFCTSLLCIALTAQGAVSTIVSTADTFVTTGPTNNLAGNNYGGAGTLMVASSSAAQGEMQSLLQFNLASTVSAFNTAYGVGGWAISSIKLSLGTNFAMAGAQPNNPIFNLVEPGSFGVDWMSNDSWIEGSGSPSSQNGIGVNFNTLSNYLSINDSSLGTFNWTAPGPSNTNVVSLWTLDQNASLDNDIDAGGLVSFRLYAADNSVGYLFNSRSFASAPGNFPQLIITAVAAPEPNTACLLGLTTLLACGIQRLRRRQ
ncbi:MAG: hypothetical protein ABI443_05420 [Chthoniobacterales bacterium]